jgi:hypothetical protein
MFCSNQHILLLFSAYDAQVAGLYYAVRPNYTGFQVSLHLAFEKSIPLSYWSILKHIAQLLKLRPKLVYFSKYLLSSIKVVNDPFIWLYIKVLNHPWSP